MLKGFLALASRQSKLNSLRKVNQKLHRGFAQRPEQDEGSEPLKGFVPYKYEDQEGSPRINYGRAAFIAAGASWFVIAVEYLNAETILRAVKGPIPEKDKQDDEGQAKSSNPLPEEYRSEYVSNLLLLVTGNCADWANEEEDQSEKEAGKNSRNHNRN